MTQDAMEWIENADVTNNGYLRNLQILCSEEFSEGRSLGLLVSLPQAYAKHLEFIKKDEERKAAKEKEQQVSKLSSYVGEVGDKLEVTCDGMTCISSWSNVYGVTYLYKFVDSDNNIYIWYASKFIEDCETVTAIKGTVKEHSEFNGAKQTIMTRCKVISRKDS
jgi:hypothetical protein